MKHIKIKMFIALLFLSNVTLGMIRKNPSPTNYALEAIKKDSPIELHIASMFNADMSYKDDYGNNLLLLAIKEGKEHAANYLSSHPYFQNNVVMDDQNIFGETALICSSLLNYKTTISNILKIKDVNLNIQDYRRKSALHWAVYHSDNDIIRLFIEKGANPTMQNEHGATVAFYGALNNRHLDPLIAEKIILAKDTCGNTQFHLLTMANIRKMTEESDTTLCDWLCHILNNFIRYNLNFLSLNNCCLNPVETAYEKYWKLYYKHKTKKSFCSKKLNTQEEILHILLLCYFQHRQNDPFISYSPYVQQLNIETAMAQKYIGNKSYYHYYTIDTKDKIRQELCADQTNIPTVWIHHTQQK